jgi:hypothetical protein
VISPWIFWTAEAAFLVLLASYVGAQLTIASYKQQVQSLLLELEQYRPMLQSLRRELEQYQTMDRRHLGLDDEERAS